MISVDLNCDLGEGMLSDAQIMPFISSANIACGYHAGSVETIKQTIETALQYNVAIGAHPGFADKENFGRKEIRLSAENYYDLITDQLKIVQQAAKEYGTAIHHVKPHGALYNMAAKDKNIAAIIAKAVKGFDDSVILYGLSGSYSISEAEAIGLKTASEVFADRTYQDDASLTPRNNSNALIAPGTKALQQVLKMVKEQVVTTVNHQIIAIKTSTVCIHGDGEHAVDFAKLIHQTLKQNNIVIKTI